MQEEIERLLLEIQRAKYTERRTEPRQPFARPVQIHFPNGPIVRAFSKDLSAMGIGIISDASFPSGAIATLEIHSTISESVILRAEVRWCDGYGKGWYLLGWKFLSIGSLPQT
jgi:hypothetical protein